MTVPNVTLNSGVTIPQLGFGVFLVPPGETEASVRSALEAGYRHIDAARLYDNEQEVGAAIATSGIARDELFVTTKVWNSDHGYDATLAAFDASLKRLGLDHVDLFLIHWPVPSADRYVETWRALERIAGDGRSRAIGVSNFQAPHLRRLIDETGTVPAVNQVELHPNSSRRTCGPSTPSTASPPRPGARSPGAACCPTPRSARSPPSTGAPRPR